MYCPWSEILILVYCYLLPVINRLCFHIIDRDLEYRYEESISELPNIYPI